MICGLSYTSHPHLTSREAWARGAKCRGLFFFFLPHHTRPGPKKKTPDFTLTAQRKLGPVICSNKKVRGNGFKPLKQVTLLQQNHPPIWNLIRGGNNKKFSSLLQYPNSSYCNNIVPSWNLFHNGPTSIISSINLLLHFQSVNLFSSIDPLLHVSDMPRYHQQHLL